MRDVRRLLSMQTVSHAHGVGFGSGGVRERGMGSIDYGPSEPALY